MLSPLRFFVGLYALLAASMLAAAADHETQQIRRGRYIALIAGCNACHTEGFASRSGNVPEREWLLGNAVGNVGPWGTTYPPNLRLYMQTLSADQWVHVAETSTMRPPMPWFDLRVMEESDLRALHAFNRHLGPAGSPAPAYAPSGSGVAGPVVRYPGAPPAPAE